MLKKTWTSDGDAAPSRHTRRAERTVLGVLFVVLVFTALWVAWWSMQYELQRFALRTLLPVLEQQLGQNKLSIERISLSSQPALVLHKVQWGTRIQVSRVEALLSPLGMNWRPEVKEVKLIHPKLENPKPIAAPQAKGETPPTKGSSPFLARLKRIKRHLGSSTIFTIVDGELLGTLALGPFNGRFTARRIHFSTRKYRLLMGPTTLELNGYAQLRIPSMALDLDRHTWRPLKGAALGAAVYLPHPSRLALSIQTIKLEKEKESLGFAVRFLGRGDQQQGRFSGQALFSAQTNFVGAQVALDRISLAPLSPNTAVRGWPTDGSTLSGRLTLAVAKETRDPRLTLHASFGASSLNLQHPWLANQRVGPFNLQGAIDASLHPTQVMVKRLSLSTKTAQMVLSGSIQRKKGHQLVSILATMPQSPCQSILQALPSGFTPTLTGMKLKGKMGVKMSLQFDSAAIANTKTNVRLHPMSCKVIQDPIHANVEALKGPVTIQVPGESGLPRQWRLDSTNPHFTPLKKLPLTLRMAFVVAEDGRFFRHKGFDTKQLRRALNANLQAGQPIRGASTISQQLVKNVYLDHGRTFARKFQEMILTWRLEQLLSKERILELYLNLVEMGPGVFGVQQASQYHFGIDASALNPLQAAYLAMLTPSPGRLSQRFAEQGLGAKWIEKTQTILRLLRRRGVISRADENRWGSTKLVLKRREKDDCQNCAQDPR